MKLTASSRPGDLRGTSFGCAVERGAPPEILKEAAGCWGYRRHSAVACSNTCHAPWPLRFSRDRMPYACMIPKVKCRVVGQCQLLFSKTPSRATVLDTSGHVSPHSTSNSSFCGHNYPLRSTLPVIDVFSPEAAMHTSGWLQQKLRHVQVATVGSKVQRCSLPWHSNTEQRLPHDDGACSRTLA